MSKKADIDSPASEMQFKPGGATSMPVKHYPSTTAMTQKGKDNEISGPCEGKSGYEK